MKPLRKPPGNGVSRRKEERLFIRSDKARARLKLLARNGRTRREVIEEALERLPLRDFEAHGGSELA
jgi:hypothetical protein